MERIAPFESEQLTSIAKILADTSDGMTGSQIEHTLRECKIPDPTLLVRDGWEAFFSKRLSRLRDIGQKPRG